MQSFTIRISGKVQGVSFREYAKGKAYELRLNGFIRNEPDGSVYAEVEGEEEDLKKFIEWCHEGPESAKVDEVKGTRQPFRDFQSFEIERSTDGVHFEMIASVKAVGNSNTTQNYSAKDQNPVNGINFYRLKQVDLDGKSSYSQIVTVNFGKYAAPTMFPNPATSFFTVVAGMEPIKEIELYSVAGVRLQLVKNDAANSSIKISSANLSSGVYIVQIRTASNIYKQKLLKQ